MNDGDVAWILISAALVLGLHGNNPRSLADFLAKNRARLEAILGNAAAVLSMEIQALSMAGANVVFREIADLAHTYPRDENGAILDWLMQD